MRGVRLLSVVWVLLLAVFAAADARAFVGSTDNLGPARLRLAKNDPLTLAENAYLDPFHAFSQAAAFPNHAPAAARRATDSDGDSNGGDGGTRPLTPGKIAGIVVGAVVATAFFAWIIHRVLKQARVRKERIKGGRVDWSDVGYLC